MGPPLVDLLAPEVIRNPFPLFSELRDQHPIHWMERHHAWLVTRHHDVSALLTDDRLSADTMSPLVERLENCRRTDFDRTVHMLRGWMIFHDGPMHRQLRQPLVPAFAPSHVDGTQNLISELVGELLESLESRPVIDVLADFAFPFSTSVINAIVGLETADEHELRRWGRGLSGLLSGAIGRQDVWERAAEAERGFSALWERIETTCPEGENREVENRIVSGVRTSSLQIDDAERDTSGVGPLSMLAFAGHETSANLIANGVAALLAHQSQLERLRADHTLIDTTVEEVLRWCGPVKLVVRRVRHGFEFGGCRFAEGQPIYLALAAANRDPGVFEDPEVFDIGRDPRKHLAFGWGSHYCLGSRLARLEARIAIYGLVTSFVDMKLAVEYEELAWHRNVVGRTLKQLPVIILS